MRLNVRRFLQVSIGCALLALALVSFRNWPYSHRETVEKSFGSDRVVYSKDGKVLQILRADFSKRRFPWLNLDQMGLAVQKAIIESEDRRFRSHFGLDPIGLIRAARVYTSGSRIQGASTITMQLADLIEPSVLESNAKITKGSWLHKLKQMLRASLIELTWTKDQILEAYLNLIHLRGEYQGVPAVAEGFFGVPALALSEAQATVIAASISSPNQKGSQLYPKACLLWKKVLKENTASLDCEALRSAISEYADRPVLAFEDAQHAPHIAARLLKAGRLQSRTYTSLDYDLQVRVKQILDKNISALRMKNVTDAAAIVIENSTGNVLAYVGSVGSSRSPHVDGVIAPRQAGSTLKPFLYAEAIQRKLITAASVILDDDTAISWSGGVYRPTNYDRSFHGPVSAREALASSLNVPAVKIVTMVGLHDSYKTIERLGLTGLKEPDFYGVSMALGAVEVRLDELTNAYRSFANAGLWAPLIFENESLTSLSDRRSKLEGRKIFSPGAAAILSSILSDAEARLMGFGHESPLETTFWTAVKTGTSKDYRDNWCIGYSSDFTVGVWAGNFDATAMEKVSGVSGAAPSWAEIMSYLHRSRKSMEAPDPSEVVRKKVRHPWRSQPREELFLTGTEPAAEDLEVSQDQTVQIVFPANDSVLVVDPRMDAANVALFVRFKGAIPSGSELYLSGQRKGEAKSPFKIEKVPLGAQKIEIRGPDGKILSQVRFFVRGIEMD